MNEIRKSITLIPVYGDGQKILKFEGHYKTEKRVRALPIDAKDGKVTGYKGNITKGDQVEIKKHPARSAADPIEGVVVGETENVYLVRIDCPMNRSYILSLNKRSLAVRGEKHISEIVNQFEIKPAKLQIIVETETEYFIRAYCPDRMIRHLIIRKEQLFTKEGERIEQYVHYFSE